MTVSNPQPRILSGLYKVFGSNWKTVSRLMRVNQQVLKGWRYQGFTYSVACRLKFELDQFIRDLKQYSDELDVIIRERRNLRGYRFPPEEVKKKGEFNGTRHIAHKKTGPSESEGPQVEE